MDIKTVFFLLLSFLLGGHNQFAADDNASAANFPYKFGEMRLLSSHSEITTRYKKIGSCLVVDGIEADCRYHDWHGISYVVFEGEVVRIEANRESLKKGGEVAFRSCSRRRQRIGIEEIATISKCRRRRGFADGLEIGRKERLCSGRR